MHLLHRGNAFTIQNFVGIDRAQFILSQENPNGDWRQMVRDGLGSLRGIVDDNLSEIYAADYAPYGEVWHSSGVEESLFAFTGEMLDSNGLQYHRARYYDPGMGVWLSLDPLETANRYGYVGGNTVNFTDASGLLPNVNSSCYGIDLYQQCIPQCEQFCSNEYKQRWGERVAARVYEQCANLSERYNILLTSNPTNRQISPWEPWQVQYMFNSVNKQSEQISNVASATFAELFSIGFEMIMYDPTLWYWLC